MSTVRSDRPGETLPPASVGVFAALSVAAIGAALVVFVWPDLLPHDDAWFLFVWGLGGVALFWGFSRLSTAIRTPVRAAAIDGIESRSIGTVPGAAIDRLLAGSERDPVRRHRQREAITDRVREAARTVLADRPDVTDDPDAAIAAGTWTADGEAAALLTDERVTDRWLDRIEIGDRRIAPSFAERVRRAVGELAALAGVDPPAGATSEREDRTVPDAGVHSTDRWLGVGAFALLCLGAGAITASPGLVVAAAATAGLLGYARLWGDPTAAVTVERRIEPVRTAPGEAVSVTLTVTNEGSRWLTDLRIVDPVPPAVTVLEGHPRQASALRPGARTTLTYTVEAPRGRVAFEDPVVIARSPSGFRERVTRPTVAGDTAIEYDADRAAETPVALRAQASRQIGRLRTTDSGPGVEFHSVRAYRPGDPLGRIDWRRFARDRTLATVEFHAERAATTVVVIDTRAPAYVTTDPAGPSAVDRSVLAAADLIGAVLEADHRVGLAALSPRSCWIGPAGGSNHRARVLETLATDPAFDARPPDTPFLQSAAVAALIERLPADAQVIAFSPLADGASVEMLRTIEARGHPVTAISPNPTVGGGPGRLLAAIERDRRLTECRRAGLRTVDWGAEPLEIALERARRRWST